MASLMQRRCGQWSGMTLEATQSRSIGTRLYTQASLLPSRPQLVVGLSNSPQHPAPSIQRKSIAPVASAAGVQFKGAVASPNSALKPGPAATKPVWFAPSGQPGIDGAFAAPLVGRTEPMGASLDSTTGAVNFALLSGCASAVKLVLFTEADLAAGRSTLEVALDPEANRTGDVWHIMLPMMDHDLLYGYRVSGPSQLTNNEHSGHRYDDSVVILDPYAQTVLGRRQYGQLGPDLPWKEPGVLGFANTWPQMACALPGPDDDEEFDWEGDRPLNIPMEELVIYEMHVRGFTQDESSGVGAPGTYAGMIERLDYLANLGVNAVELLPVQEFNELEYYALIPGSNPPEYRVNFWGYSTVGYFAPMSRYSANIAAGGPPRSLAHEFKTMIKECHKRGIEVIMDVVFNHTAEGNDKGLTLSFRGLDNRTWYMLAPGGEYYNYSGCGNTINTNHPAVRQFIIDCLRYWVTEYHVDGFRFDLASILTRAHSAWHPTRYDEDGLVIPPLAVGPLVDAASGESHSPPIPAEQQPGEATESVPPPTGAILDPATGLITDGAGFPTGTPLADPPLIEMISEDPVLRDTKMIAEAWDCDGLNQVGAFPHYGGRWSEWNGKFRDTVRNFIKGMDGWAGAFASAMCGSPDMYANDQPPETDWWATNAGRKWRGNRSPTASINFVTAHDGFTLADLVSYNEKHNEANGEDNRDGESHNISWNCGEEGPTGDWNVRRLRQRQMRNMAMALMLAHGVPMLVMGDEYGHSKHGNNNTYCHDNELNWFDWVAAERDEGGFARFMRLLVNFRRSRPELMRKTYVSARDVQWHGELADTPDWSETSRLVAYTMNNHDGTGLFIAFNTSHVPRVLTLPSGQNGWGGNIWQPLVDTAKLAPYDFLEADEVLSEEDVGRARSAALMWTANNTYAMLPWSAIILEATPERVSRAIKYTDLETYEKLNTLPPRVPAFESTDSD